MWVLTMIDPVLSTDVMVLLAGIAGVVWAVRLEGKVNEHDNRFCERDRKFDERNQDLKDRLVRIETKLDTLQRFNVDTVDPGPASLPR